MAQQQQHRHGGSIGMASWRGNSVAISAGSSSEKHVYGSIMAISGMAYRSVAGVA